MATTPKILVQYSPKDAVREAVPDLQKIQQATRTFEYQARNFSFTTLLQRIATDFKLDGIINLVDNDGNRVGPEILKNSVELTELRVEGSGPVAKSVQPRERVWGKIKAMCSRMPYPNVLEELIENSLDAIDIERDKTKNDFHGKIIVTTNREERSIRIRDNGSGMEANFIKLESIMALGNDGDHTGSGNGEYNEGMKTVAKFGMQEMKLEVSIMSKTAASDTVVQVQLPLKNVKEDGVWNPIVGKVGPEPTLFGPSDGNCEPPFPGLHGTVVTLSHADKVAFRELCVSETDPKLKCLPKLAAKYCFRTTGAAEFLNDALNQSGATTTRPFTGTFKSNLSPIDIIIDRDCLRDQDNIVLERVLEILAKSDDKKAAREKLCAAESAAEESATAGSGRVAEMPSKGSWPLKPLWFVEYKVESEASGQKEIGVVKVVAFFDSALDEPSDEEGETHHKGPPENQVLGFWNGVFFGTMSLEVVPWFNKAKMDKSNSPQVQAAYDRVKLFVFVDKAFRPDVQKQILSSGSLYTELCTDSKNSKNSRTVLSVKKALVEKVSEWFKADVTETYGPVATRRYENSQFAWEYVDVKLPEGASPTSKTSTETQASKTKAGASVTRQKQDTGRLWAQNQGKNGKTTKGSVVEFESEVSGSGSTSKTLLFGTITDLITTESEPITSGRAKIDIPFAESVEVHVSKITRLLTPDEEKARLDLVKDSMPNDIAIHVFVGCEKPKNGRGFKSVTSSSNPSSQLHYLPVENSSSTTRRATSGAASRTKLLEMTADQARDFGLMVEVINGSGKLVQDGGEHGHAKSSVMNLKNLTCRIEVWDCKRNIALPHPRSGDGADWFDIVKVDNRSTGARYFSDKQQPSITDFLENVGEYQIKFFFGFRDLQADGSDSDEDGRVFPGQRRSVQEHLDEKFRIPGEPSGLRGTLDIKIIPGKPCKAFGKVDNCYWLGDPRPLRELSIKDKFDNPLPLETITDIDVECISEALEAKVQREGSVWNLVIKGVEGRALQSEEVDLDFDVLTSWTDSSTIAKALVGKGSSCTGAAGRIEPLTGRLRFRGKVQIYSGLPHFLTIKPAADMSVTGLPRGELLKLTVDVKDQWGTVFRGKHGHLTLDLALEASEGMTPSKKLTIEDLESGDVKLPDKLKVRIEGDYNSTGTLKISCTVRDMRGGKVLRRADIGAENTLDVQVQEARLLFVVPDKVGESSEKSDGEYELEIETRHLSRLIHTVQLQVQLPSGAVMKNVGGTARLSKIVSGKPEAEQSVFVRRGEAIVEIVDPQKIDETMPCTFRAHFHGLQAALNLWVVHGAPQSVSVGPDTEHEVMIGKEWPVFFKVLDAEKVVMRDPDMFSLSLECDDGLKFEIKDRSVAFNDEHMAFKAIAVPAGCVRSETNETNKANVRLHVRLAEQHDDGPPPPPPEHDDLCPAHLLKASMDIIVKAEDAVKLQFFSSGTVREEHPYESGKPLDLCIRAVDQHGNVDKSFNGRIEIMVDDSATQPSDQMQGGVLFLNGDKWKQFTKAAHIQLNASHIVKNKKTHTLEPASCRLNVSLGSWAESIKVLPHPLLEGKRVVIDDSALAFEGFQACVVANDGTKISGAKLEARFADRVYNSSPNEKDPSVLEFEPMEVPEKEGQWSLELFLVDDDDDKATRSPPDPGITVRRTPGKPASFALQAELDHLQGSRLNTLTVCAEKEFWLHVEAKNKLGVPLSLEELRRQDELFEVHFELLDRDTGIKLEYPRGNLQGQDALKARVGVIETAQGLCQGITTSMRGYALFQKQRMYTNTIELTFHPHLEVQKNEVAFAEVEEAMNKIQKDLETTKKTQTRLKTEHKKATAAVDVVRNQLAPDKLPPMDVLQSELDEAAAICKFRQGKKFLSEPDPTPRPCPWTQAYEDARRQGLLPESGALGVVAGLGYVDAEGDQTLFAEGIAALAGSCLQAVVVPTEQAFAQWEPFAAEHEIRTLVMTPLSNVERERVKSVLDGPPAGAHSAVGKIKVEELFVADVDLKKRLFSELWAKLLLDALIFETYPQMQAYRAQHGRTHRMAARRANGTWCVSDVGEVPGQDAPQYVKLRVLVPGESTAEYRDADRKVKEATSKMTKRKDLEEQLGLKLKAAQDIQDKLDAEGCEAKIADLKVQMEKRKDQVAALRGSTEELSEGAGRGKKRSKKGGGGEGGGSSSSRARGKHPREENQETPQRNTRQRGIASPSHGAASASQNLNLRSAAGGRAAADS